MSCVTPPFADVEIRPFNFLGGDNHGWLDTKHHFSFADYYDHARNNWGSLRVWNDDIIMPKSGFPLHPHKNFEIITYVREGAISHKDSTGNSGRTEAGDIQVMSAGSGIRHSEYNLESTTAKIFQIWIQPDVSGGEPYWEARSFPKTNSNDEFIILASGFDSEIQAGALPIRAKARLLAASIKPGQSLSYVLNKGRVAYFVPSEGTLSVNEGLAVGERDGVAVKVPEGLDQAKIVVTATSDVISKVVMVDIRA